MFNFLKRLVFFCLLLAVLLFVVVVLRRQGLVPGFTDTKDLEYRKFCGVEPSSGSVWRWHRDEAAGGFVYYRLNLSNNSYVNRSGVILTETYKPDLPDAPWWWGAGTNGHSTIESSGSSYSKTRRHEIYDPDRELLFVYAEW